MERRSLHHVIAPAVAHQVPEDPAREAKLRADASPSVRVKLGTPRDRDHVYLRQSGPGLWVPLEQRQVRDRVPAPRDILREVAVPPLGAADGMWIQTVENEADTHERHRGLHDSLS